MAGTIKLYCNEYRLCVPVGRFTGEQIGRSFHKLWIARQEKPFICRSTGEGLTEIFTRGEHISSNKNCIWLCITVLIYASNTVSPRFERRHYPRPILPPHLAFGSVHKVGLPWKFKKVDKF